MRSEEETDALCEQLFNKRFALLDNMTMREAIERKKFAMYIGTTKLAPKAEALRWMTKRGAQNQGVTRSGHVVYKGQRNRPVLVHFDGTCITMKEAQEEFGAKSVITSSSRLRLNETSLEDALQTPIQPERLGLGRLHRNPTMGAKLAAKAAEEMSDPDFLAKTSMACLRVTGFDESNKGKPKWVEFNNKRAKVNY
jgi:hypothetical protein